MKHASRRPLVWLIFDVGQKMRSPHEFAAAVIAFGSLSLTGCLSEGPLSVDHRIATRQVAALIPNGTSEFSAKKALSDRGFQLSRLSSDVAGSNVTIGTYTKNQKLWQVGLIFVDGKVVASTVQTPKR